MQARRDGGVEGCNRHLFLYRGPFLKIFYFEKYIKDNIDYREKTKRKSFILIGQPFNPKKFCVCSWRLFVLEDLYMNSNK